MSDGKGRASEELVTTQEMRDLARQVIPTSGQNVSVDDATYMARVSRQLGVPDAARVDRIMVTPEARAMEARVETRIAASSTGEAGALSVERKQPTQEERDQARQAMPPRQAQQASRRAQEEAAQTHALTL